MKLKEGWANHEEEMVNHYYRDGVSLCGFWKLAGKRLRPLLSTDIPCSLCRRLLEEAP